MGVRRFSTGFGPAMWAGRCGETEWVVGAIPLGGYVAIDGMSPADEVDPGDDRSYANKPAWRRIAVLGAGSGANYLLAFLIGVPMLMTEHDVADLDVARIAAVTPGSAAEKGGLLAGDVVVRVGGTAVTTWQEMSTAIGATATAAKGGPIPVVVRRDGPDVTLSVTPEQEGANFRIGVSPGTMTLQPMTFAGAVPQAAGNLWLQTVNTLSGLRRAFTSGKKGLDDMKGPPGIVELLAKAAAEGLKSFMGLVWALSISVGLFNLMPFPGLDGGRLIFLAYEVVARRRANERVEMYANAAGLLTMLALIAFVSLKDVIKFLPG